MAAFTSVTVVFLAACQIIAGVGSQSVSFGKVEENSILRVLETGQSADEYFSRCASGDEMYVLAGYQGLLLAWAVYLAIRAPPAPRPKQSHSDTLKYNLVTVPVSLY